MGNLQHLLPVNKVDAFLRISPTNEPTTRPRDSQLHGCNKRFYVFFIQVTFFTFFNVFFIFPRFLLFKKTLSNVKYKYVKIQRKIFLEDDLAMIFIDFGLLRSLYCKLSYLLAEER